MNAFIDHLDVFEDEMTGGEVNSEKSEQTVERHHAEWLRVFLWQSGNAKG